MKIFIVIAVFCICFVAFVVPFHPLKQGLHDLLVNTVVVRKGKFSSEKLSTLKDDRKTKRTYAIAGLLFFLLLIGFFILEQVAKKNTELPFMIKIAQELENSTLLQNVNVEYHYPNVNANKFRDTIVILGFLPKNFFVDEDIIQKEFKKAFEILRKNPPEKRDLKYIDVSFQFSSGYNIGISYFYIIRALPGKESEILTPFLQGQKSRFNLDL